MSALGIEREASMSVSSKVPSPEGTMVKTPSSALKASSTFVIRRGLRILTPSLSHVKSPCPHKSSRFSSSLKKR